MFHPVEEVLRRPARQRAAAGPAGPARPATQLLSCNLTTRWSRGRGTPLPDGPGWPRPSPSRRAGGGRQAAVPVLKDQGSPSLPLECLLTHPRPPATASPPSARPPASARPTPNSSPVPSARQGAAGRPVHPIPGRRLALRPPALTPVPAWPGPGFFLFYSRHLSGNEKAPRWLNTLAAPRLRLPLLGHFAGSRAPAAR